MKTFCICIAGFLGLLLLALNGCTSFNSTWGSNPNNTRTNEISDLAPSPYHQETPTLAQLAQTYRSQDKTYHSSRIRIFSDGEFVWNSLTTMSQTFRGNIYDLNSEGFAVKLSDGSGDSFYFKFTPDKHGFWSLDEYGNEVEEYLK